MNSLRKLRKAATGLVQNFNAQPVQRKYMQSQVGQKLTYGEVARLPVLPATTEIQNANGGFKFMTGYSRVGGPDTL